MSPTPPPSLTRGLPTMGASLACWLLLTGVAAAQDGQAAAGAQMASTTAESSDLTLPIAPVLGVLVGLIVFLALRVRAWLGLEVEPALREVREAAEGLQRTAAPPVLRRLILDEGQRPAVLGESWLEPGTVSVVGADGVDVLLRTVCDLLSTGTGTVVLGAEALDDHALADVLRQRGLDPQAITAARRLLRTEVDDMLRDPAGVLSAVGLQEPPITLVAAPRKDNASEAGFVAGLRKVVARAEPACREGQAALLLVLTDAPPGAARLLADAPGLDRARWWTGDALVFPSSEAAAEREASA